MSKFYVYGGFCTLGLLFYVGKGCGNRWEVHQKDAHFPDNPMRGSRAVHKFIRDMEARGEPQRWHQLFTGLDDDWALDLETAIVEKFGLKRHGGQLENRQRPRKRPPSTEAVAHVSRYKRLLQLPALEPIRVSRRATVYFDEISGGQHPSEHKTFHRSGVDLWLDERTRSQIDMFRHGKRETYSEALLRLAEMAEKEAA
jgi:hypothetical protein